MFIRHIVIVTIRIGFLCTCVFSQPGTTENTLYHLLNINDEGFLTNAARGTQHPALMSIPENAQLSMRYDYEDLYREFGLFTVNRQRYVLDYRLPAGYFSNKSTLSLHVARERLRFNHPEQAGELPDLNLSSEYSQWGNRYRLGISVGFNHTISSNRVTIDHYPDSADNWLLNRYFYDLLQPTFGNTIDMEMYLNRLAIIGEYFYKSQEWLELGTKISLIQLENKTELRYFNSNEKLSGHKIIDIPFKSTRFSWQIMAISAIRALEMRFFFGVDRTRYALDLIPENPSKSGDTYIDYTDLGDCTVKRTGYNLGLGADYPVTHRLKLTIANSFSSDRWQGQGTVYTPVLGFEILPIAHHFKGTARAGTVANHLQLQLNHQPWQRFFYTFHLGWLAAKVKPQWQGTAYMEFGIDNRQYNDQKTYNAHIFVLAFSPTLQLFKKWSVQYTLSQLIPMINEEGITTAQKPQPPAETQPAKSKTGGGRIHQFVITYNF